MKTDDKNKILQCLSTAYTKLTTGSFKVNLNYIFKACDVSKLKPEPINQ